MQSVRTRIAALSIAVALIALTTGSAHAAFINLTPQGNATNSANFVALSALIAQPDDIIVVGDKWFSGFSYSQTGDMPASTGVNILGFRDPDGNWGITMQGAFADFPGGGASDAAIRFMVEVDPAFAAQGWRINDAHLFLGGVGALGTGSYFGVDESYLENNETMYVEFSTINAGNQQLSDSVIFPEPTTKLTVSKDILAFANQSGSSPSRATVIDQSFSQILIPEPSSMILMGMALTFGWIGFRSRSTK